VPETFANPQAPAHVFTSQCSARRPWDAPAPLRLWHLASLDAPTVAVVWALGFSWAAGIVLPPWVLLLLALVTWAVYVVDRLLDARTGLRTGATHRLRLRHHFHWRHRRILIPLALAAGCAALGMVIALMPPPAREGNTVLAAAALAYFARIHSRSGLLTGRGRAMPRVLAFRFPLKELLVALLFTAACTLPAFSRLPAAGTAWPLAATAAFFALVAFVNCHAIEQWESNSRPFTGSQTFRIASLLGILGILLAAFLFPSNARPAALLAAGAASALLLALLDRMRNRLTPVALRVAADLVLLTPASISALALLVR
jgi:hypothetical protein